jgi:predicted exporter
MRGRGLAIGLWAAGSMLALLQVVQTRFVADLSMFLPEAPTEEQRLLVDQLRDGALTRMAFIGIDGADAATRARVSAALKDKLKSGPGPGLAPIFSLVANGQGGGLEVDRDLLMRHRYALSPNVTPERFSIEGLRAAVGETVDLLASPAGMLVKALVARDPTAEMVTIAERLRPEGGPRLVEGVWASADGKRALLVARTRAAGSDTDAQARAVQAIEDSFRAVVNEIGPRPNAAETAAGVTLTLTGPGVFAARSRALIQHDVERLAAASLILVAAILLSVYRSPLTLALGLVPVLSGALAGIAAVSLGFGAVHGITLGFGTTLIGEAIDYSIYLFVQSERSQGVGDADWVAGFWPTIRLGVLTSIAGFSALVFSGLPGLAQLGVYSIAGLAVAAAVTRFVLPALLPASLRIRDLTPAGEKLLAATRVLARGRWVVALAALAAAAVLATRASLWDADLASLNPISAEDRAEDLRMRADLGAADARSIVAVRGEAEQAALEAAERVGRELDALVASGKLAGYESPARILPSAATQRARIAALPEPEVLRERLARALAQSPLPAARLGPFLEDVARARQQPPLERAELAGSTLESALEGLLFRDATGRWNAIIALHAAPGAPIDAGAVRSALAASGTGALLVDLKSEADRLYAGYLGRAAKMSAVGLAVIVALLFAALREPMRVARVMAPLVAGVLVVAAWHALSGTRLTLLHLVGLLLVVAIGSNYALFFDRMAHSGSGAARTLASLTLANATTVASFGVLAVSTIPILHAIGATVALGAAATLLFSAALAAPSTIGSGETTRINAHDRR